MIDCFLFAHNIPTADFQVDSESQFEMLQEKRMSIKTPEYKTLIDVRKDVLTIFSDKLMIHSMTTYLSC